MNYLSVLIMFILTTIKLENCYMNKNAPAGFS